MTSLASASLGILLLLCPSSLLLKRMWQRGISVEWIFNTPPLRWLIHVPRASLLIAALYLSQACSPSWWSNNLTFSQERWREDILIKPSAEVIDICYPVHLLNIILLFSSFDWNCFPPCQSQLVEGSSDWTSTGGQTDHNYPQRRERGVSVSDVWCDLSDSAESAFKRGASDAMTLTEPCNQLDSSEHERLRKLLSGSEWQFIITTSLACREEKTEGETWGEGQINQSRARWRSLSCQISACSKIFLSNVKFVICGLKRISLFS